MQSITNFFDVANLQMFSVIGNKNKRFYAECIVELYQYTTVSTSFCPREEALSILSIVEERYKGRLEKEDESFENDETDGEEENILPADGVPTARYVYRRLRNSGWIEEIYSSTRRRISVCFTAIGGAIAEQMLFSTNRAKKVTLGGYVRNVISDLEAMKTAPHPYGDALRLAVNSAQNLMRDFRQVVSGVNDDIERISAQANNTEAGIHSFMEFNQKYANGVFAQFQKDEYLSPADKAKISALLDEVVDSMEDETDGFYQKLLDDVQDSFGYEEEDAVRTIRNSIDSIRRILLEEYDELATELAGGQNGFLQRAMRVVVSQLGDRPFASKLAYSFSVLRTLSLSDENDDIFDFVADHIHLPEVGAIDTESLYKEKAAPRTISDDYNVVEETDMDAILEQENKRSLKRPYSVYEMNKLIEKMLEGKEEILSSELDISTRDGRKKYVSIYLCQDIEKLFKYRVVPVMDTEGKTVTVTEDGLSWPVYRIQRQEGERKA